MSEALLSGGLGLLAGVAISLAVSHLRRRRLRPGGTVKRAKHHANTTDAPVQTVA